MKRPAKGDPLARILKAAREDPAFFHDLVFSPKKAIAKAPFLDRATRTSLLGVRAGTVIAGLLGKLAACGNDQTCSGSTCSSTCSGDTCKGATCGGGSCSETCRGSCPDTISPPKAEFLAGRLESIRWKAVRARVTPRIRARPGR